jgi:hypothetical protein
MQRTASEATPAPQFGQCMDCLGVDSMACILLGATWRGTFLQVYFIYRLSATKVFSS